MCQCVSFVSSLNSVMVFVAVAVSVSFMCGSGGVWGLGFSVIV